MNICTAGSYTVHEVTRQCNHSQAFRGLLSHDMAKDTVVGAELCLPRRPDDQTCMLHVILEDPVDAVEDTQDTKEHLGAMIVQKT